MYISQQWVQSFRASRWASTAETAEAVRNGSTPISFSRVSVLGASFVCSVERTRWPVSAASIAILAVSPSRTSPTMTTSGSERRIERSAVAKVSPARTLICIWFTPASRYSTGSSTVITLISGRSIWVSAAYSVVDLPEPVGPVTRIAPVGRAISELNVARISSDMPEHLERRRLLRLVEQAHDDRLAGDGRQRREADVEQAARGRRAQGDPAVLGPAPLGDVQLREHLEARGHPGHVLLGNPLHLVQDAVDPEPDEQAVLLGLEVDVARSVLGRLEHDRVDDPDDRPVRDAVLLLEVGDGIVRNVLLVVERLDRPRR